MAHSYIWCQCSMPAIMSTGHSTWKLKEPTSTNKASEETSLSLVKCFAFTHQCSPTKRANLGQHLHAYSSTNSSHDSTDIPHDSTDSPHDFTFKEYCSAWCKYHHFQITMFVFEVQVHLVLLFSKLPKCVTAVLSNAWLRKKHNMRFALR